MSINSQQSTPSGSQSPTSEAISGISTQDAAGEYVTHHVGPEEEVHVDRYRYEYDYARHRRRRGGTESPPPRPPPRPLSPFSRDTAFWNACKNDDIMWAVDLLKQGANVNVERTYHFLKRKHRQGDPDGEIDLDDRDAARKRTRNGGGEYRHATRQRGPPESASEDESDSDGRGNEIYENMGEVSALFVATREDHTRTVNWLLGRPGITEDSLCKRYRGETVLHKAVGRRLVLVVKELVNHPCAARLPDIRNHRGDTPFELAVVFNDLELVRIFLTSRHRSSFIDAAYLGNLLVEVVRSNRSHPPKNVATARLLLINGAQVNYQDRKGNTALHYACLKADVAMMNLLLAWKADKELRNNIGKVPQGLAPEGRSDVLQALERTIIKYETPVPWSMELSTQHPISKDFNVDVTFTSFKSTEPFTWSRSWPISEFLKRDTPANVGAQNDDKKDVGEKYGVGNDDGTRHEIGARGGKTVRFEDDGNDANAEATKAGSKSHGKNTARSKGTAAPNILGSLQEQFLEMVRLEGWKIRSKNVMRWIHLPNNNMTWVKDVVAMMCEDYKANHGQSEHQYYTPQFVENTICARKSNANNIHRRFPHVQRQLIDGGNETEDRVSIVVPYIDFESERYLLQRQGTVTGETQLTVRQRKLKELEAQFGQYDGSSGLQLPETFDQSYYDGSTSLDERNTDQVVYKWFKDTNDGSEPKILVVRQLWIWRLDERTVLTAIPPRWDEEPKETLYDSISRFLPQAALATPYALIQQILLQCLRSPNEFEQAGVGYHILDIFESWIAKQQDREVALFRAFRKFIEDSDDVTEDHTDQKALRIDQEVKIIYELKDALEELFILRQLFITQQKIASSYHELYPQGHYYRRGEEHGISKEDFEAQSGLEGLIARADRLEANAKMVLENVDHLVSVKQTQSSLIQSQLAAKQAEVANNQAKLAHEEARRSRQLNNYVLLFTFVTIIFTPLAFMISMFAVPIQGFPRDDSGELFYGSSWITGRLFAGELVTLFVVCLGFLLIRRMNRGDNDLSELNAPDMVPQNNMGVMAESTPVSFHDKPATGHQAIPKRNLREATSLLGPRLRARAKELRGRQPEEDVERQQPS